MFKDNGDWMGFDTIVQRFEHNKIDKRNTIKN